MKIEIIIIIGAYGSGKSEYSINYAWQMQNLGIPVSLVDLDVVNPYFRSREVRSQFINTGIEMVAPDAEFNHADQPMLTPRIMGAVQDLSRQVILDVGGDPAGCRTLARYVNNIKLRGYELKFVINTSRPFTSDYKGIVEMLENLEYSSKLKVTELICNTNLMQFTDENLVTAGINLIDEVAQKQNLKFTDYLVMDKFVSQIPDGIAGKKRVIMNYYLNKPWEKKT
ncbi:MAG: hypothetical protein K9N06_12610 [Candidatus Cloacimonetes bacterium]|nr:hypothetical protein [Candidatus Cloacimonadota bacterium]